MDRDDEDVLAKLGFRLNDGDVGDDAPHEAERFPEEVGAETDDPG